jgi:hypothetical protein
MTEPRLVYSRLQVRSVFNECILMAIKKQEFYEGAALYQLIKTNKVERATFAYPFVIINDKFAILIKYSTSKDSPWNFAFTETELIEISSPGHGLDYFAGLVCGSDGVVALSALQLKEVAPEIAASVRIGCYRKHDHHYQVNGPAGTLSRKISRSAWTRILGEGEEA